MRFVIGFLVLAMGLFLITGDIFLGAWGLAAGSASDIRARGTWLLATFVPYIAVAILMIVVATTFVTGRRRRLTPWSRELAGFAATLIACTVLYYDQTGSVWRILLPLRTRLGIVGAVVLDIALLGVGVWLLVRPGHSSAPPGVIGEQRIGQK